MRDGGLGGAFQFGEDLCGEDLAEFHAPLIEAVDVPDGSLGEDGVLVEGDELAEECGGGFVSIGSKVSYRGFRQWQHKIVTSGSIIL